jgi:hypothetical protein
MRLWGLWSCRVHLLLRPDDRGPNGLRSAILWRRALQLQCRLPRRLHLCIGRRPLLLDERVRDAMRNNTGFVLLGSAGELRMGFPSSLTG